MNKEKLLVVVDMQNDFVTGALANENAQKIVGDVANFVRNWDGDIVFTRDTHHDDYMTTSEGKKLPVPHCIENTNGWEIVDELKEFTPNPTFNYDLPIGVDYICDNGVMIVDKSSFGGIGLGELVREKNYKEITLIGVCTGICVISNAVVVRTFASSQANVKVIGDLCACLTPETHKTALEAMKTFQVDVI